MPKIAALPPAEWITPDETERLVQLREEMGQLPIIAIDTETTGLDPVRCVPLYWSLALGESLEEPRPGEPWRCRRIAMPATTLPFFTDVFLDPTRVWVLANAKFDMHMLANVGIELSGAVADIQVMHGLLYEEEAHDLKYLNQRMYGWTWQGFSETFGKVKKRPKEGEPTAGDLLRKKEQEDLWQLVEYASNDTFGTLKIFGELLAELEAYSTFALWSEDFTTLSDYFWKFQVPYTKVLWSNERARALIDRQYVDSLRKPLQDRINDLDRQIWQLVGRPINPGSSAELVRYFYDELKLPKKHWTSGGKTGVRVPATTDEALREMDNEVADLVLDRRDVSKTLTTYVKGIDKFLDDRGRVGYRINQSRVVTGRLSSAEINIQNIKKAGEDDIFHVRRAFIAKPGHVLIVFDYNALEMRLLAAASMEPGMIQLFKEGKDIHMGNALLVFGAQLSQQFNRTVTYEDFVWAKKADKKWKAAEEKGEPCPFTPEECRFITALMDARSAVKTIGFGLVYGLREKALARKMGCTVEEALAKMEAFMTTYPAVGKFCDEAVEETRTTGCAFTLLGRRRYLPLIASPRPFDRWRAERQAKNTPIQGTAADVVGMAMIRLYEEGLTEKTGAVMLFQVHDELVFECPAELAAAALPWIKERMEHPFKEDLAVPLAVEGGIGPNWESAK